LEFFHIPLLKKEIVALLLNRNTEACRKIFNTRQFYGHSKTFLSSIASDEYVIENPASVGEQKQKKQVSQLFGHYFSFCCFQVRSKLHFLPSSNFL